MAKKYCNKADIEDYLMLDIAESFDTRIDKWIEGVSETVRLMTNRDWLADDTASIKYYSGNGCSKLDIDDFIGSPTLRIGDDFATNFASNTNFVTMPFNSVHKNSIKLKNENFPTGIQNIEVTARWGYGEDVPEDIRLATTILASAVVLAGTNQDGEIATEKIGNYQVSYKDDKHKDDAKMAMDILQTRRVYAI